MGRGRKGVTNQSNKKMTKNHRADEKNRVTWLIGLDDTTNKPQNFDMTEELLTALRQMNSRDIANILVNS